MMAASNDFLLFADPAYAGLEKSPLLVWAGALSIKLFGPTAFAFKLPGLLPALLSVYATYQLARLLYGQNTARLSALILATCQGIFLGGSHGGPEVLLMACIITAIWCFRAFAIKRRWHFLILGALAVACGILTKGLIALLLPMAAISIHWILARKWNRLFSPLHVLTFLLIAALLLPVATGIYHRSGLSSQEWLATFADNSAWEYLLGRSPAAGTYSGVEGSDWPGAFYMLPGAIVSLLPWTLLVICAVVLNLQKLAKRNFQLRKNREFISTGGLIAAYVLLSFPFGLPVPYLVVALPLCAVVSGRLVRHFIQTSKYPKLQQTFTGLQTLTAAFMMLAALAIPTLIFNSSLLALVLWAVAFLVWLVISVRNKKANRLLWTSVAGVVLSNVFFMHFFYASLRNYDAGVLAGKYIYAHNIPAEQVSSYRMEAPLFSLDFYARRTIPATMEWPAPEKDNYLLLMDHDIAQLVLLQRPYEVVLSGRLHQRKWWRPAFIDHNTRGQVTQAWSLIRFL